MLEEQKLSDDHPHPTHGFCLGHGNHVLFDPCCRLAFLQEWNHGNLWLQCGQDLTCDHNPDEVACFPIALQEVQLFVELCSFVFSKDCPKQEYKRTWNWKRSLDWLGMSPQDQVTFSQQLQPGLDAWLDFRLPWPHPDAQSLNTYPCLAIAHRCGHPLLPPTPMSLPHVKLPQPIWDYLRQYKTQIILAGSACLNQEDHGDVDLWVLNQPNWRTHMTQLIQLGHANGYEWGRNKDVVTGTHDELNRLQLIPARCSTPEQVIAGFDFDVIRCWYDGTHMHHTWASHYCQEQKWMSVPHEAEIHKTQRIAHYYYKGFSMHPGQQAVTVVGPRNKHKKKVPSLHSQLHDLRPKLLVTRDYEWIPTEWAQVKVEEDHGEYECQVYQDQDYVLFRGQPEAFAAFYRDGINLKGPMWSYLIRNCQVAQYYYGGLPFIVHNHKLVAGRKSWIFQTADPDYPLLYDAFSDYHVPKACYELRSGKKRRVQMNQTFTQKKYPDVPIFVMETCPIYQHGVVCHLGLEAIPFTQVMHVEVIPVEINEERIQWKAQAIYLVLPTK